MLKKNTERKKQKQHQMLWTNKTRDEKEPMQVLVSSIK